MKLYLYCGHCSTKIYLSSNATTRTALMNQWGYYFNIQCPHCTSNMQYTVYHAYAEADTNNAGPGALIGGIVGLLGGPLGVLLGGVIGGAAGHQTGENDRRLVQQFNNS